MRKRIISLFTALTLMITMIIGSSIVFVDAATKYDVPVKAVYYYNDYEDDDPTLDNAVWKKTTTERYTYNSKGNVTSVGKIKATWNYKNKKPVKVTAGSKKLRARTVATYKKGRIKTSALKVYNKKGKTVLKASEKFSYNSKKWLSKYVETVGKNKYTVTYSYEFYSNGMPKKIKVKDRYNKEKTYTETLTFNDKGLITKLKNADGTTKYKYKYDSEGRVIEKIEIWEDYPQSKTIYKYDNKKTRDKKTYIGIVNRYEMRGAVRDAIPDAYGMLAKM